jgi:hypothetical protein
VSYATKAVGYEGRECDKSARALVSFADLDGFGKHACDTIKPCDQIGRSGWVSVSRSDSICWTELAAVFSMTTRPTTRAVNFVSIEPKRMLTGMSRKFSMLAGKTTSRDEAIELHEELLDCQMSEV